MITNDDPTLGTQASKDDNKPSNPANPHSDNSGNPQISLTHSAKPAAKTRHRAKSVDWDKKYVFSLERLYKRDVLSNQASGISSKRGLSPLSGTDLNAFNLPVEGVTATAQISQIPHVSQISQIPQTAHIEIKAETEAEAAEVGSKNSNSLNLNTSPSGEDPNLKEVARCIEDIIGRIEATEAEVPNILSNILSDVDASKSSNPSSGGAALMPLGDSTEPLRNTPEPSSDAATIPPNDTEDPKRIREATIDETHRTTETTSEATTENTPETTPEESASAVKDRLERQITRNITSAKHPGDLYRIASKNFKLLNALHVSALYNRLAHFHRGSSNKSRKPKNNFDTYWIKKCEDLLLDPAIFERPVITARDIANNTWSIATLASGGHATAKRESILDLLCMKSLSVGLNSFNPQELGMMGWSMAKLKRSHSRFQNAMAIHLKKRGLGSFDSQSIVNLSSFYVTAYGCNQRRDMLSLLEERAHQLLSANECSLFEAGTLASEFANSFHHSTRLFDALESLFMSTDPAVMIDHTLCDFAKAFARIGRHDVHVFSRIAALISKRDLRKVFAKDLACLAQSFAIASYYEPTIFQSILDAAKATILGGHPKDAHLFIEFIEFCAFLPCKLKVDPNLEKYARDSVKTLTQPGLRPICDGVRKFLQTSLGSKKFTIDNQFEIAGRKVDIAIQSTEDARLRFAVMISEDRKYVDEIECSGRFRLMRTPLTRLGWHCIEIVGSQWSKCLTQEQKEQYFSSLLAAPYEPVPTPILIDLKSAIGKLEVPANKMQSIFSTMHFSQSKPVPISQSKPVPKENKHSQESPFGAIAPKSATPPRGVESQMPYFSLFSQSILSTTALDAVRAEETAVSVSTKGANNQSNKKAIVFQIDKTKEENKGAVENQLQKQLQKAPTLELTDDDFINPEECPVPSIAQSSLFDSECIVIDARHGTAPLLTFMRSMGHEQEREQTARDENSVNNVNNVSTEIEFSDANTDVYKVMIEQDTTFQEDNKLQEDNKRQRDDILLEDNTGQKDHKSQEDQILHEKNAESKEKLDSEQPAPKKFRGIRQLLPLPTSTSEQGMDNSILLSLPKGPRKKLLAAQNNSDSAMGTHMETQMGSQSGSQKPESKTTSDSPPKSEWTTRVPNFFFGPVSVPTPEKTSPLLFSQPKQPGQKSSNRKKDGQKAGRKNHRAGRKINKNRKSGGNATGTGGNATGGNAPRANGQSGQTRPNRPRRRNPKS